MTQTVADPFRHEYDLAALERIRPHGHEFDMLVTPRYLGHFAAPYEPFTGALVAALSRRRRLFVDVGAHYGFFSLLAAHHNPDIEVLACEPVPESHEVLARNLALNGVQRATLERRAVSSRSGTARIHRASSSDNCGFYPHPWAPPIGSIEVDTVTVDELLAGHPPCSTVIKIDTDGHEIPVLAGMAQTLERFPETALVVELNPKMQRLAGYEPEDLLLELDRLGFDVFLLDDSLRRAYPLRRAAVWRELMSRPESYVNLYCCRRATALSVCFVSHSAGLEGAQRSLVELVGELVEDHGAVCTVVLPEEGPLRLRLAAAGAAILQAPLPWWCDVQDAPSGEQASGGLVSQLAPGARALLAELGEEIARLDPDVLVSHTLVVPWGALLASALGKPHVWHACEHVSSLRSPLPGDELATLVRSSSNLVFTASRSIRDELFPQGDDRRSLVLYRHIPLPEPSAEAPAYFAPGEAVRLAQLGTYTPAKGQDVVIESVALLVARGWKVELLLAGGSAPDRRAELAELVSARRLQEVVRLEGFIDHPEEALRQTDVVLLGSRSEGFGRVAVEAMLLAKPVVYPQTGGLAEYMRDGETGLAYPVGDAAAMAARIETLLADPGRRAELGRRAREYALATFTREGYGGAAAQALRALRGGEPRLAPLWSTLLARVAREALDEARSWRTRGEDEIGRRQAVETALAEARAELAAHEEELRGLRGAAIDLHATLEHRGEQVRVLGAELELAEEQARTLEGHLAEARIDFSAATRAHHEVLVSTTWAAARWLRRPFDALLPIGSHRRGLLRALFLRVAGPGV